MDIDFIIEPYIIIQQLGEGTYGRVFKAQNKITQEIVAIKQIQTNDEERQEGVQSTTLREMSVLSLFKGNPNIVQLKDVILADNYKQFLVMEYIETDLRSLIEKAPLTENQVKLYLYQLLKGLYALHSRHIFHRDLKPGNILVQNGVAKLADFGLAKPIGSPIDRLHTREVQTLWYRAPELLLGNFHYSPALDVFSLGCIFFEMLNRQPLFRGSSEIEQIFKIFQMVGTPTNWKGFTAMPFYSVKFPHFRANWQDTPNMSAKGKVLLRDMLAIDPCERISAKDALKHPYFDDINKLQTTDSHHKVFELIDQKDEVQEELYKFWKQIVSKMGYEELLKIGKHSDSLEIIQSLNLLEELRIAEPMEKINLRQEMKDLKKELLLKQDKLFEIMENQSKLQEQNVQLMKMLFKRERPEVQSARLSKQNSNVQSPVTRDSRFTSMFSRQLIKVPGTHHQHK